MNLHFLAGLTNAHLSLPWELGNYAVILLYFGPETIMPLASIVTAVVGFLLIFWRILLKPFKAVAKRFRKNDDELLTDDLSLPELQGETDESI